MAEGTMVPQKLILEILCAIQGSLGKENQRVFARAGRSLGAEWAATISRAGSVDELMGKMAAYLQEGLQLAETVTFEKEGMDYVLKVRRCAICHGKLVKEKHGISAACAISMFPIGALVRNLGIKNARLKEIRKSGPIGDCHLVYEIGR